MRRRKLRSPSYNATRKRRIAAMECVYGCGDCPMGGNVCKTCRGIERFKAKTLYQERRAAGRCTKCGRKAVVNPKTGRPKVHCLRHDRMRQRLEDE